jgi:hypothetical protein
MPYTAEINRSQPGCYLFLVDQSASMDEVLETEGEPERLDTPIEVDGMTYTHSVGGISKADCVADVINRTIYELIMQCMRHDGCRHYFDVGVIGYNSKRVGSALGGDLGERLLQPLPLLEQYPLRIEERTPRHRRGAPEKVPVWVETENEGETPMCRALELATDAVKGWCAAQPRSHPPIVINITDGQSSDGDPEGPARALRAVSTNDGGTLLFNLLFEPSEADPILFPHREQDLPSRNGRTLFRMSSEFPEKMRFFARERGHDLHPQARMVGYKAGMQTLVRCFEIATRASQLR